MSHENELVQLLAESYELLTKRLLLATVTELTTVDADRRWKLKPADKYVQSAVELGLENAAMFEGETVVDAFVFFWPFVTRQVEEDLGP